ncbi:MAG: hypothetical protein U0S50_03955 [Sphingopyxis sp.]|uniref:hypothetical protein n=1 Tax=Sphingopyxis sp. TaxID=1908224 RepID=UPI002ABC949F|nr:hypothetical protein [Sphingopyxis sp.]MDZ3830957.1 hypothetical protein [Sphingopyxis sp.]
MQNALPLLSSALAALTLSGCATTNQPTPLPNGRNVALGQAAFADGPIIQPVAVLEDSRCPVGTLCVWAGRVRVKMLWLRPTGEKKPFEVTLGERSQIADGSLLLESVLPAKRADSVIAPADYRFSMRFDGGF